jgi:hypothetical protein
MVELFDCSKKHRVEEEKCFCWSQTQVGDRQLRHVTTFGPFLTRNDNAFADDQTVQVLPDMASVRGECEAADVESGTFRFFDELGRSLIPRFIVPVRRTSLLFGIKLVGGGNFELDLNPQDQGSAFETSLANVVAIEPNRWFATIADLVSYVAEKRKNEV